MDRGSAVEDAGTPARRRRGEKWWFLWSIRRLAPVAVLLHRLKEVDAADAARCCWAPRRTRALPAERVIIAMKDWLETKRGGGRGGSVVASLHKRLESSNDKVNHQEQARNNSQARQAGCRTEDGRLL